jgi:hypothetical protein
MSKAMLMKSRRWTQMTHLVAGKPEVCWQLQRKNVSHTNNVVFAPINLRLQG